MSYLDMARRVMEGLPEPVMAPPAVGPDPPIARTASTPAAAPPILPAPAPAVSSQELQPDLFEQWEERVCIMHYDGRLPWPEAEALALADVLRVAGREIGLAGADPGPEVNRPFPDVTESG